MSEMGFHEARDTQVVMFPKSTKLNNYKDSFCKVHDCHARLSISQVRCVISTKIYTY